MDGDELIAYLFHQIPFDHPFGKPNYDYQVLLVYPQRTNQRLVLYYAREMGLDDDVPVVFKMRLHDGQVRCEGAFSLKDASEEAVPLGLWLSEATALHLESTVVGDCLHLLGRGPYDVSPFKEAAWELARRDARSDDSPETLANRPCGQEHMAVGPQCLVPKLCAFKDECWKRIPQPNAYDIVDMDPVEARKLQFEGIMSFPEVAKALREGRIELKPHQAKQVLACVRERRCP